MTNRRRLAALFAAPLLAGLAGAQSSSVPEAWRGTRDDDRPRPAPRADATGDELEWFVPADLGLLSAGTPAYSQPFAAGALAAVRRADFDGAKLNALVFESVPGGIVLGVPARPLSERPLDGRLERTDAGLVLVTTAGDRLALPSEDPALVRAAYAFATSALGDWVVDLESDGTVVLARPLVDTPAGLVAVRADLVPQFFLPVYAGGKSLIVDRDVRAIVRGDALVLEADLEVRFFRPGAPVVGGSAADRVGTVPLACAVGDDGRLTLTAPEGPPLENIARHLDRLSALAGWIGFFRWARASGIEGLDRVASLPVDATEPVRTPRRVYRGDTPAWIAGARMRPPAEVPSWMRAHRERVLAGQR